MKKGFTLIELLAVIVILALILVIAVPMILGVVEKAKMGAVESDAKLIYDALKKKMAMNDTYEYTDITEDNVEEKLGIKSDNYEDLVITTVDGKPRVLLVGKGKYEGYTAYGNESNMTVVRSEDYDIKAPVITLLGNNPMNVAKDSTYIEPGATASDNKDGNISDDIVITGTVDTATIGSYTKTYKVSDANGNKATATRTVNVVDNIAPVITMLGSSPININLGDTYTDAGATANDNLDGDITGNIIVTSTVNTAIIGTYTVTYAVSDSVGNAATQVVRTVNVLAAPVNFSYTGTAQTFTAPMSGTYKLEVWGAEGYYNGKGGYSSGNVSLTQGQILYVYVGGKGSYVSAGAYGISTQTNTVAGGYNGGGGASAYGYWTSASVWRYGHAGSGGGATHIAKVSGLLSSLSGNRSNVLIVAGGGGGYFDLWGYGGYSVTNFGYSGGGLTDASNGITQSAGFGFGAGQSASSGNSPGGGGGWYGGYYGNNAGGSGGSGYIGGVTNGQTIIGNATMPSISGETETGHTGDGHAKITFISQ